MSFSTLLIRRTASSMLPRTVRSIGQRTYYVSAISTTTLKNNPTNNITSFSEEFRQIPWVQTRNFSLVSNNPDNHLLRVVKSEITCAEEEHDQVNEIPDGFPFKIQDEPGMKTVLLEREHRGEVIKVIVHMPELTNDEDGQDDKEDEAGDDENEDENENNGQSIIAMVVSVSKGKNQPWLEFGCTAYRDEITIDSLIVKDPDTSEDDLAYEGPHFSDLDENLQKAFYKYLEDRGIKPSTTNFLYEYMFNKDDREYITWLKTLKNFIEK